MILRSKKCRKNDSSFCRAASRGVPEFRSGSGPALDLAGEVPVESRFWQIFPYIEISDSGTVPVSAKIWANFPDLLVPGTNKEINVERGTTAEIKGVNIKIKKKEKLEKRKFLIQSLIVIRCFTLFPYGKNFF